MHKALYGMMCSALLFYHMLVGDLQSYGFTINRYDLCVAKTDMNGSQMTVVWYVDDLKITHTKAIEITKLAMYLDGIYHGLKVNRGKMHDYLGMNLNFSEDGNIKVSMIPYLNEILRDSTELLGDIATSPAAHHLFKIPRWQSTAAP